MYQMKLVKNIYTYWEFIRNLRNLDGVRQGFVQQSYITKEEHEKFMLKNSNCFWICVQDEIEMGFVGVIKDDIRIATHPNYQGLGVGSFMLDEIVKKYPNATAKIKIENNPSLRLFEKCGFTRKYYIMRKND